MPPVAGIETVPRRQLYICEAWQIAEASEC